ncbi:MAG: ABC transporter permease [Bacteroidota bacterium]
MFDLDKWQEIFETLVKNPLRSFLTSFAVGWGIFMLILLLGLAKGLENGIRTQFEGDAINSIWMWSGKTTLTHEGLQPGRSIQFTNEDFEILQQRLPEFSDITGRFYIPGGQQIVYGTEYGDYNVRCVHPDHQILENTGVYLGRYLNQRDLDEFRKVAVIGKKVQREFLEMDDPIGEYISINGISFRVVGVYHEFGDEDEEDQVYIPITTAQRSFNGSHFINQIMFTIGDADIEESQRIEQQVRTLLAERHHFAIEDRQAVNIRNMVEQFQQFMNVMTGIKIFSWIIALGTLLAGVIGVSNIMLVVVKERTQEIGIRKALGATPGSILGLIMQESIFLTTVAGYIGIMLALPLLNLLGKFLPEMIEIFGAPEVSFSIVFSALVVLIVAGALAGLIPALRAASIRPIEALRDE